MLHFFQRYPCWPVEKISTPFLRLPCALFFLSRFFWIDNIKSRKSSPKRSFAVVLSAKNMSHSKSYFVERLEQRRKHIFRNAHESCCNCSLPRDALMRFRNSQKCVTWSKDREASNFLMLTLFFRCTPLKKFWSGEKKKRNKNFVCLRVCLSVPKGVPNGDRHQVF